MYDHRIGIAALALFALPFALTFMLATLIGVATVCTLLGHIGTLLSRILKIILPLRILTNYLEALSSPFSLLIAAILVSGIVAAWIYLAVRYNDFLFESKTKYPPTATSENNEPVAIEVTDHHSDDRTIIHQAAIPFDDKPELSDSNPFIRRVLRNTDYDSFTQMHEPTPQPRLRSTARAFELSPLSRPEQRLRPTAKGYQFLPFEGPGKWRAAHEGGGFIVREMSGSFDGVQEDEMFGGSRFRWAH